jgi:hypothetical protein
LCPTIRFGSTAGKPAKLQLRPMRDLIRFLFPGESTLSDASACYETSSDLWLFLD